MFSFSCFFSAKFAKAIGRLWSWELVGLHHYLSQLFLLWGSALYLIQKVQEGRRQVIYFYRRKVEADFVKNE